MSGGAGVLAACSVFDLDGFGSASGDIVTVMGQVFGNSDCPTGVALVSGSDVAWFSDSLGQGNAVWYTTGYPDGDGNGCGAKGTCGPTEWSWDEPGGGWELCFVPPILGCTNPTASDYNPSATVEDGSCTSGTPFRAGVKLEIWTGIGGGSTVAGLTSSPAYLADTPTATDFLTPPGLFAVDAGVNAQDLSTDGMRLTTYFLAPQSGDYTFVVTADDTGELWLGADASTLQLIASSPRFTLAWDTLPQQTSAPQRLEAGSYYMLMALEKNAPTPQMGPSHASTAVGVTLPDGEELRPIPVRGYLFEPPPTIHGCTNPTSTNFNLLAEADDLSCFGGRLVGAKLDIWEGISGDAVSDLTSNPAYLAEMPTSTEVLAIGAVLETEAGGVDNDAVIVAWGVGLTGCADFAAWLGADASTGCEIDFIRRSANCDEACQTHDGNAGRLKRFCPGTCGANDNLGSRLTAYFRASQTGDYTFVIAADDTGELWLGSDEGTLQLIASVPGRTDSREWDKFPQQTSALQRLEAGRLYLLTALAKNGAGGANLAVGVTLPDGEELRPIPVQGYLFEEPEGCTNPTATNFDPLAVADDGSCLGCTNPTASNFDPLAGASDGSCLGCTNPMATNFDPAADVEDGSCVGMAQCHSGLYFEAYAGFSERSLPEDGVFDGMWHGMTPTAQHEEHTHELSYDNAAAFAQEINGFSETDHFAMRWRGEITISSDGDYSFQMSADDGSKLFIDRQLVVDNDEPWGGWVCAPCDGIYYQLGDGAVHLAAGLHEITIVFREDGGGENLEVKWTPTPGAELVTMASDALSNSVGC